MKIAMIGYGKMGKAIEEIAVGRCEMRSGSQPLLSAIVKQVKFIIASKVGRQYPRTPSE